VLLFILRYVCKIRALAEIKDGYIQLTMPPHQLSVASCEKNILVMLLCDTNHVLSSDYSEEKGIVILRKREQKKEGFMMVVKV
jgi:hypothetical protein